MLVLKCFTNIISFVKLDKLVSFCFKFYLKDSKGMKIKFIKIKNGDGDLAEERFEVNGGVILK